MTKLDHIAGTSTRCVLVLVVLTLIGLFLGIAPASQAQSPSLRKSIQGRVVGADSGTPLRSARVHLIAASQSVPPVFTDADGRFVILVAADGASSSLSVTKPGYLVTTFTPPRGDAGTEIRLPKAGAISGRIIDTLGDPVIGMPVTAETSAGAGSERRVAATGQTDDRGEYRLAGLPSGRFLVSVNSMSMAIGEGGTVSLRIEGRATDEMRRQMQMRVYLYPGVQAPVDALPVSLNAGEDRPAVDFVAPARKPVDTVGGAGSSVVPRGTLPGGASAANGVIRGRVVAIDGRALPQAIVRLEVDGPGSIIYPAAITDQEGRYEFQGLGHRIYTLTATRTGFLTTAYGQRRPAEGAAPIELQPGELRNDVDIVLFHPGAIAGRVVDDAGEPIEDAGVRVLNTRYQDGRRRLVDAGGQGTHRTDDRGVYRIYGLPPGEYVVSASVGRAVPGLPIADRPGFSTSYASGTVNPAEARRIAVDLAGEVSDVDVSLIGAPAARISGTVVDAAGRPLDDGLILTPSGRSGVLAGDSMSARMDPDGRFEFPNVTPGEYVIQASKGGDNPNDEGESFSQFVTIGNTDMAGVAIRLSRGSTIKGRITFEGQAAPEAYFALNLQAVPVDVDRTPQSLETPASARIQQDGAFDMAGLSGARVLRLTEAVGDWRLKAVLLNGLDVTDTPLPFGTPNQSIDGLEVVLTDRRTEVRGRALDARARGMTDATVAVFSTDRALWGVASRWGETSRFLAAVKTGKDGVFNLRNLPPGDYYAAAVTEVRPGEWRDPDLLDALIPNAAHLIIFDGDTLTTTLSTVTR